MQAAIPRKTIVMSSFHVKRRIGNNILSQLAGSGAGGEEDVKDVHFDIIGLPLFTWNSSSSFTYLTHILFYFSTLSAGANCEAIPAIEDAPTTPLSYIVSAALAGTMISAPCSCKPSKNSARRWRFDPRSDGTCYSNR